MCYGFIMFAPIFMLALAFQASPKPDASNGAYLVHACQSAIREMDHPNDDSAKVYEAAICMFYIQGFMDGEDAAGKGACWMNASYENVVKAYVAYMEKHPKMMEMDKRVGLVLALGNAFPCPAKP
jgi:hypothetical protein